MSASCAVQYVLSSAQMTGILGIFVVCNKDVSGNRTALLLPSLRINGSAQVDNRVSLSSSHSGDLVPGTRYRGSCMESNICTSIPDATGAAAVHGKYCLHGYRHGLTIVSNTQKTGAHGNVEQTEDSLVEGPLDEEHGRTE